MIILAATTDKLQVISSSAATLDVHVSYVDLTATPAYTPGKQNTAISSAATTDILAAPGASTYRNAKAINIRNKDAALACTVTVQYNQNGTLIELHKTLVQAGEVLQFHEGIGWFLVTNNTTNSLMKVLTSDDTAGQAVATAQPWFPNAGSLTVPAATTFRMTGLLMITTGATSHSTAISFGGTATITSLDYYAQAHRSAANAISSTFSGIAVASASAAVVDVAATTAAHYIQINGILRINAAGTLIPQFTFSANPTGTITVKRNSFFRLEALGDNTFATQGTWS